MRECWRFGPRERPTFKQIVAELADGMNSRFHEISFYCRWRREEGDSGYPSGSAGTGAAATAGPASSNSPANATLSDDNTADSDTPLNPLSKSRAGCSQVGSSLRSANAEEDDDEFDDEDSDVEASRPVCRDNRRPPKPAPGADKALMSAALKKSSSVPNYNNFNPPMRTLAANAAAALPKEGANSAKVAPAATIGRSPLSNGTLASSASYMNGQAHVAV